MKEKKEIVNKRIILEELRLAFDKIYLTSDALDSKLQNLFGFSTAIVGITSTIQTAVFYNKVGFAFWIMVVLVVVLYFLMLWIVVRGLKPVKHNLQITDNWDVLVDRYFHVDEEDILNVNISQYLSAMDNVSKRNEPKITAVRQVTTIMAVTIFLMLLSVPLGLVFPAH